MSFYKYDNFQILYKNPDVNQKPVVPLWILDQTPCSISKWFESDSKTSSQLTLAIVLSFSNRSVFYIKF